MEKLSRIFVFNFDASDSNMWSWGTNDLPIIIRFCHIGQCITESNLKSFAKICILLLVKILKKNCCGLSQHNHTILPRIKWLLVKLFSICGLINSLFRYFCCQRNLFPIDIDSCAFYLPNYFEIADNRCFCSCRLKSSYSELHIS